jgi:SSS family solute:Na+ symporter
VEAAIVIGVVAIYLVIVLCIGVYSWKKSLPTPEDYFMASRSFGTLVLIMAVYATNMTAFYMMGIPGKAYHAGIGLYGYVGFGTAIVTAAFFYAVGYRAWVLGKAHGFMTQPEIYGRRWESRAVSTVVFVLLVIYTIPYVCTAVIGGGLAIEFITRSAIPYRWGALLTILTVTIYTSMGGMRGTAWTNVFQGFVFIVVGIMAFVLIGQKLGGLSHITTEVLTTKAGLLMRSGNFTPKTWFSYLLVSPLAVVVFPQVFMRLLTGKKATNFKRLVTWYPIIVLLTWPPVIYIGLWGAVLNPGLVGKASDSILPWMVAHYLPAVLSGLALAGIVAAIMSSIDAMLLSLSTMFTRDILATYVPGLLRGRQVASGRLFVIGIAALVYVGALVRPSSIFVIATFAFFGYVVAIPTMVGGLYWRRSTKYGALTSLIVSAVLVPVFQFTDVFTCLQFGFLPNIPLLVIATGLFVFVSLLTVPSGQENTDRFFAPLDRVYSRKTRRVDGGR